MTSLVSAAPGGASIPGTEMAGPPGCASGTGGRSNRSRSRPGWALGGTICAPGGTTCATAANETRPSPKPPRWRVRTRACPLHLTNGRKFYAMATLGASAVNCPVSAILPDVSKRSHRLAAMLQVAGCRGPTGGSIILELPSGPVRYMSREVNRGYVGVDVDARQQAGER